MDYWSVCLTCWLMATPSTPSYGSWTAHSRSWPWTHRRLMRRGAAMNAAFNAKWLLSFPTVMGLIYGILRNALVSKVSQPTHRCSFSSIDAAAVQKVKEEVMSRVTSTSAPDVSIPYISTHDVVASRFLSIASQPANVVAINCRNRLPNITHVMAGNYEAQVLYPLSDVQRPEQIRRSVIALHCDSQKLPATWATMSGFGAVSDWTSFYYQVEFDGLTLQAHLPVFTPFPYNVGAISILFRLRGQDRAVFTNLPTAVDSQWRQADIIGKSG